MGRLSRETTAPHEYISKAPRHILKYIWQKLSLFKFATRPIENNIVFNTHGPSCYFTPAWLTMLTRVLMNGCNGQPRAHDEGLAWQGVQLLGREAAWLAEEVEQSGEQRRSRRDWVARVGMTR